MNDVANEETSDSHANDDSHVSHETLHRRVRALRLELASRSHMVRAVQEQCKLDVERARVERDDALNELELVVKERDAKQSRDRALAATNAGLVLAVERLRREEARSRANANAVERERDDARAEALKEREKKEQSERAMEEGKARMNELARDAERASEDAKVALTIEREARSEVERALRQLEGELEEAKGEAERASEDANRALNDAREAKDAVERALRALEGEHVELKREAERASEDANEALTKEREAKDAVERALRALEGEHVELKREAERASEEANRALSDEREAKHAVERALRALEATNASLVADVERLRREANEQESEAIQAARRERDDAKEVLMRTQEAKDAVERESSALAATNASLVADVERARVEAAERERESVEALAKERKAKCDAESALSALSATNVELVAELDGLRGDAADRDGEAVQAARRERDDAKEALEKERKAKDDAEIALSGLAATNAELMQEANRARSLAEERESDFERVAQRERKAKESLAKEREQKVAAENAMSALTATNAGLVEEVKRLSARGAGEDEGKVIRAARRERDEANDALKRASAKKDEVERESRALAATNARLAEEMKRLREGEDGQDGGFVRAARRERDDAHEALAREREAKDAAERALSALAATNAELLEEVKRLRGDEDERESARFAALREDYERVSQRLVDAEEACANASGHVDANAATTPDRSPSAVPLKKKVAILEARSRDGIAAQREELIKFMNREKNQRETKKPSGGGQVASTSAGAQREDADTSELASWRARDAALDLYIARSDALDALLEVLNRACAVLERSSEKIRVHEGKIMVNVDDDDDVPPSPRSWEDVARDLRHPDAALEALSLWVDASRESAHYQSMARVSSAVHLAVFALKRSAGAAAQASQETREAYALADEASQVYRINLSQAETEVKLAISRATAAEEANETISKLASEARAEAEASSKIAEAARRDLKRRESELAVRDLSTSMELMSSSPGSSSRSPLRGPRPIAPFPSPEALSPTRLHNRKSSGDGASGIFLSPALRELQILRRALEHDDG